jgi:hypothetical protein
MPKVSFCNCLLVRNFEFWAKITTIGMSIDCQTDTLPTLLRVFRNYFLDFTVLTNEKKYPLIHRFTVSHVFLPILIDKRNIKRLVLLFSIVTLKNNRYVTRFFSLEKQLYVIVYYTYGFVNLSYVFLNKVIKL